jgi:hypothetical protein
MHRPVGAGKRTKYPAVKSGYIAFRRTRPKALRSTMTRWLAPPRAKGKQADDMNLTAVAA